MKRLLIPSSLALFSAGLLVTSIAAAQAVVQPLPGTTNADRLADTMRRLAVSPTDVGALLDAGELSLKVDDLSGAASLFARADKVDPRSARAKAGMAAILVRAERPGEALRYYAQAEALGVAPARIAADRGLAYDLIGEQERAQRDYRLALKTTGDEEAVRRYALSLGISGRRDQALAVLDPLLRRSDRGAWRARAFVLAMTGDVGGASTIATTMMPSGMAQGLLPFFQRLPSLGAADRAFAVHFGEVRATPERLADARLTPTLVPLAPEPQPPVVLAAAVPVKAAVERDERRRDRRGRRDRSVVEAAVGRPGPGSVAAPASVPASTPIAVASTPVASTPAVAATRVLPPTEQPVTRVATVPAPIQSAAAGTGAPSAPTSLLPSRPTSLPATGAASVAAIATSPPPTPTVIVTPAAPAHASTPMPTPALVAMSVPTARAAATVSPPVTRPAQDSVLARIIANLSLPAGELGVRPTRVPTATVAEARARSAADTAARRSAVSKIAAAEPVRRAASEATSDDASAGTTPRTRRAGGRGEPVELADATSKPQTVRTRGRARNEPQEADAAPDNTAETPRSGRARGRNKDRTGVGEAAVPAQGRDRHADDADAAPSVRGRSARDREELADASSSRRRGPRASDDDRSVVARRGADKAESKVAERKAARAMPERIWVQVATGANEGDLPKAWNAVRGKAPDAFKGRAGYTAPLRATNRVVTGPFKTAGEAQAFVNGLAKKGLSASTFTSDAGQQVSKLPASK